MKKILIAATVIVSLIFISSWSLALAKEKGSGAEQKKPRLSREEMQKRKEEILQKRRGAGNPQYAFQQRMRVMKKEFETQKAEHEKFVAQLEAIKKLALEEKAPKTAEKLAALIKQQKEKFAKAEEKFKQRQEQFEKMMSMFKSRTRRPRSDEDAAGEGKGPGRGAGRGRRGQGQGQGGPGRGQGRGQNQQ